MTSSRSVRVAFAVGFLVGAYWFFLGRPDRVMESPHEDGETWPEEEFHVAEGAAGVVRAAKSEEGSSAPEYSAVKNVELAPGVVQEASSALKGAIAEVSLQEEFRTLLTMTKKGAVTGTGIPFLSELKRGSPACSKDLRGQWLLGGDAPEDYEVVVQDGFIGLHGVTPKAGLDVEVNRCGPASTALGKLLKFSMWVKAQGVSDYANIHVRALGPHGERLVWNENNNKGFRDSFDWKLLSVEVGIPEEATDLQVGITFESPGRAWFHSPTVQILE